MKILGKNYLQTVAFLSALTTLPLLVTAEASWVVWTNEQANNNWNDADNWSSHHVPTWSSDVIVRGVPQAQIRSEESGTAHLLHVGDGDHGDLAIFGSLTTEGATVGYATYGIVTIDGGHWTIINNASVSLGSGHAGDGGIGDLVLKNGGIFSSGGSFYMGGSYASVGGLQIGAMQDQAATVPGVLDVSYLNATGNSALSSVQFNHTGTDYWFTRNGLSTGDGIGIGDHIQVILTAGVTSFKAESSYLGGTYLNGGTLSVTNNNQLGHISSALHFNGGILRTPNNAGDFFEGREITWGEHGGGFDTNNATLILNTALTGGTLRKLGEGYLNLMEAVNLTGIEFAEGSSSSSTVFLDKASTVGTVHFDGGRLQAADDLTVESIFGDHGNLIVGNIFTVNSGNYGGQMLVGDLIKNGPEALVLSSNSNFQEVHNFDVNGGAVSITGLSDHGSEAKFDNITVTGADSTLDMDRVGTTHVKNLSIQNGGTVLVHGAGAKFDVATEDGNTISVTNGKLTLAQNGEFHSSHSDIHLGTSGSLNLGAALGEEAVAAGVLTVDAGRKISGTGNVVFNHTGNLSFAVPITEGIHVTKAGSGTTSLVGTHNYTGETHISGGTLEVSGSESSLTAGAFYIGYHGAGDFVLESGTSAQVGQAYLGRFVGDSGTGTILGQFSALTLAVGYQGTGVLTVNDSLTIGGGTGTVSLGFSNQGFGTLNLGSGSVLNGSVHASEVHGGSGGGLVNFNHTNNYTLNAALTGNLSIYKENSGTTTLAGANTYTGETFITQGVLALGAGALISGSSRIAIAAGATLDVTAAPLTLGAAQTLSGNGTVVGDVLVLGTLSPGNSVGTLHFNDNLTLDSSATVVMELASLTAFDILNGAGGDLTFGGTLEIHFLGDYTPGINDAFQLFTGFASYHGNFSSVVFADPGYSGTFDTETNNLIITAVPEPASWLLVGVALLFFCILRRRRFLTHE